MKRWTRGRFRGVLLVLAGLGALLVFVQNVQTQEPPVSQATQQPPDGAPAAELPTPAPDANQPISAAPATTASASAPTYVGADMCQACHEPVWNELQRTTHGKRGFAELSEHGCETCHGPGSAHVENPDDPALRPRFERFSPEERSNTCRGCHDGQHAMLWEGSPHEQHGLSCDSCHSVHDAHSDGGQLKTATATDTCTGCHLNVRAELWKTSHHPVREGKMSCNDCHNPHGTTTESLLNAASVNEQCYRCHTEKRGPFVWEHAPVREDCTTCHAPHGSNHIKLQKTTVPFICQQCHANTRHPGTMYDGFRVPSLEVEDPNPNASNRIFNRACLDCHSAIHGSNHPSGPYLGR